MVTPRRGRGSLGCLVTLLVLAVVVYFALPIGEAYLRYYRFEDEMKQAARFARMNSDAAIRSRLVAAADSIGLPPEARTIGIQRAGGRIIIDAQYVEEFYLPGLVREHVFTPRVEAAY